MGRERASNSGGTPAGDAERVVEIRQLLGRVNLRTTAARIAVVRKLQDATTPLSHAEVADGLVPLGFDKATVFRNLTDLVEADLVTRTELGDHVWRFEWKDQNHPDRGQHPHFVCVDCGNVTCLHDVDLTPSTKSSWTKVGRVTEILLKGHCKACQSS